MPNPAALLAFLDATLGDSITLTLRQIGQVVGWAPRSGRWDTESCSGPPRKPTPLLRGLTLALEAGWQLDALPGDAGIRFRRGGAPHAPAPIEPKPVTPGLGPYATSPGPQRRHTPVEDPTSHLVRLLGEREKALDPDTTLH
jgi:hypothetical protein